MISVEKGCRPKMLELAGVIHRPEDLVPEPFLSMLCFRPKRTSGKKLPDRKECEVKKEKLSSVDRHHSVEIKVEK